MTGRRAFQPIDPAAVPVRLAEYLHRRPGTLRVALDGAACAGGTELAAALEVELRLRGRTVGLISAQDFWRDAALRLEYGRHDAEALPTWLDAAALRREALEPVIRDGKYLPSLRDPVSNRATREPRRPAPAGTVLLVHGAFLLAADLPFDVTVHLALSAPALARRIPDDQAWTLPAFARYDADTCDQRRADVVLRLDDPRHPAVAGLDDHEPAAESATSTE